MVQQRHELARERVMALETLVESLGVHASTMTTGELLAAAKPKPAPVLKPAPTTKKKATRRA